MDRTFPQRVAAFVSLALSSLATGGHSAPHRPVRRRLVRAVVLLGLVGCGDSATDPAAAPLPDITPPALAISDAVNEGNPHFYFLPPVVPSPTPSGSFDASLSPRVEICESDLTGCTATPFAVFTSGNDPADVRLVLEDEHYLLNWHTDAWGLEVGAYYRITVLQASFELGYIDILVDGQGGGKNARTGDEFELKDGRTLPIKVRIEEGAASMAPASATTPDGAAAVQVPAGALDDYQELTVDPVDETATELPDDGSALPGTVYDFGPDGLEFEEPVELALAYDPTTLPTGVVESELRVYLAGPDGWELLPGGSVDLASNQVKGLTSHFSSFAILPAGVETCDASGFATLDDAVAAVGPGGTITVCDGTHSAEGVVVDKPVTIQAEAGAAPVLQTSTERAALVIDGIASGSVVLDGLTFEYSTPHPPAVGGSAYAIQAENEFDQVVIQNTTVTIDPLSRGGILGLASSIPSAALVLDNVDVTGGTRGLVTFGPDADVSNSRFTSTTWRALTYGGGASGLVESSTFDDCLGSQCIYVNDGARVDIVGNDFGLPDLSGARAPAVNQIVRYQGATGTIEDNDFVGCGEFRCIFVLLDGTQVDTRNNRFEIDPAADPFSTGFHAVIRYQSDATGTIEGNEITSCLEECIGVLDRAAVTVRDNTITLPAGSPTVWAIGGSGGVDPGPGSLPDPADAPTLLIENNTITAMGAASDPTDPATYDLDTGIWLTNSQATVSGNTITGAATGLASMEGSSVNGGQDNTIQSTWVAIRTNSIGAGDSPDDGRVTLTSSDILDYANGVWIAPGDASSDLTCNYWGGGPPSFLQSNAPADAVYEPWATGPIADGAGGACDGMLVPLTDVTVDPANAGTDQTIFATLADAMAAVEPEGRIGVVAGTHVLGGNDLFITKPVTIEGEGTPKPVIDMTGSFAAFMIQSEGVTTVRNLHFQGDTDIAINVREFASTTPYASVLIEDVTMDLPDDAVGVSAWGPQHPVDGRYIEIRNSVITGGRVGVYADHGVPDMRVVGNVLNGQLGPSGQAIQMGVGVTGLIDDNEINGCPGGCMVVGGGDPTQGSFVISNNRLFPDMSQQTDEGIRAFGGSVSLIDNLIDGRGGSHDPGDPFTWPIIAGAVTVISVNDMQLSGNTVQHVYRGLSFGSQVGTVTGSDNVIYHTSEVMNGLAGVGSLTLTLNDFTGYQNHGVGDPGLDLTCNWWGDAAGPQDIFAPAEVYTPWATAPIAQGAGGACDGMPLTEVTVDPASAGTDPAIFTTLGEAVEAVAEGGTINLVEGTHVVADGFFLTKRVTLQADPAAGSRPVVEGPTPGPLLWLNNLGPGPVTLRGFEIQGVGDANVYVTGTTGDVLLDDMIFNPGPGAFSRGVWVDADASSVIIQNSAFLGGNRGVHVDGMNGNVSVLNNTFEGQQEFVAQGALNELSDNTVHTCVDGCLEVHGAGGPTVVSNNHVTVDPSHPDQPTFIGNVIFVVNTAQLTMGGNFVEGLGGGTPIGNVVWLQGVGDATISGNTVSGAQTAVAVSFADAVSGADNVITGGSLVHDFNADGTTYDLHGNDVTGWTSPYTGSVDVHGTGGFTCNWWGSAAGPAVGAGDDFTAPPASYEPWATAPVAGGAGGACDGEQPTVATVDPVNAGTDPSIFATLQDAVDAVVEGGTVHLVAGTHDLDGDVNGYRIPKAVTIQADPAAATTPVLQGFNAPFVLGIDNQPGAVTIRGIQIESLDPGAQMIYVTGAVGDVLIDDVDFMPDPTAVAVWAYEADASSIVVQGSRFTGGNAGVSADGSDGNVSVLNNEFEGQQSNVATGAVLDFSGNQVATCADRCVDLNAWSLPAVLRNNQITVDPSHPDQPGGVLFAMSVGNVGTLTLEDNVIEGLGGGFPIQNQAILLSEIGSVVLNRNTVTGANYLMYVWNDVGSVSGADNVFVGNVLFHDEIADGTTYDLHSNDFEIAGVAYEGDDASAAGGLTCNWWGDAAGPDASGNPDFTASPDSYTPWATAPIANGAGGACDGGL